MSPFEFLNQINYGKSNIIVDEASEKAYTPFVVNRSLSYFADTVFFANEMNIHHKIDSKLQFDFLINIVRKRKRFSKWVKPEESDNIELIKKCYGYSHEKAQSILPLLSPSQITTLKAMKGGKSK